MYTEVTIAMSVFAWGFGKCGQLGNGSKDTRHTPRKPSLSHESQCTRISCGGHFTAVVTDKGEVYTFGCGKHGRLGTGDETDRLVPVRIKGGLDKEEIEEISCGIWHGAAVSKTGNVYTWGYGKIHGVLGIGKSSPVAVPTLLCGEFTGKVKGVSCGNNFTLLWTTEGTAFSWGCGRHGVLGHGDSEDKFVPTQILELTKASKVVQMSAGFAHSGAVTESGGVYMFGRGEDGALGLGRRTPCIVATPAEVTTFREIRCTKISCSVGEKHGHTLFLNFSGQVFSCGDGYKGKLGHDDQETKWIPTPIQRDCFNNERIIGIAAGGIHSAAVSQEGHVFTWGCGSDGRLGHPEGKGHRYLFRSDIPKLVEAFVGAGKALDVQCSYYHTAALLEQ